MPASKPIGKTPATSSSPSEAAASWTVQGCLPFSARQPCRPATIWTGKSPCPGPSSLIAIPTTAGTGSEITRVAVLSDHEKGIKTPLDTPAFYPDTALVDPKLT